MCGPTGESWRSCSRAETEYLNALVRGVYAARDLPAGHALSDEDVYLAIPLQKGQISCRELMRGEVLLQDVRAHAACDGHRHRQPICLESRAAADDRRAWHLTLWRTGGACGPACWRAKAGSAA